MILHVRGLICMEILWLLSRVSLSDEVKNKPGEVNEVCIFESFQPRCLKTEVILMTSATYGRMRIGKCLKTEEVAAHRSSVGDDPRYFGCSADVLTILDKKCSGRKECDIRLSDIPEESIQPCFPGLKMYLEISYECVNIVDEERSCTLTASKTSANILTSLDGQQICGTKSQPWTVEAPVGQRIAISLLDFGVKNPQQQQQHQTGSKLSCKNYGHIVDKAGKRNASICVGGTQREKELYLSTGNTVKIYFNFPDRRNFTEDDRRFLLSVKADGCSDIIPTEDTWLKRKDDTIVIGCYSSRQAWHLTCERGKWIGVLGNCSQSGFTPDSQDQSEPKSTLSENGQVLAIVAIGGFTLAICLTIVCVGAICLRRFYTNIKKEEYKKLNSSINYPRSQQTCQRFQSNLVINSTDNDSHGVPLVPSYSVYVGEGDHINIADANSSLCDRA